MRRPGESRGFDFTAINPGLYVYHCAVPMAAQHIANGMYGLILVEPEGGLPKVDHEFYVMQGEIYTEQKFGAKGELTESYDKLMNERPEYFVFNGAVGALVGGEAAQGQGRRDRAHLLRRRRSELHLLVPRDRRDVRQGLQHGFADHRPGQ